MKRLLTRIFLPFQRAFEVTLVLSSGRTLTFTATKVETSRSMVTQKLNSLKAVASNGFPHWLDLVEVQAITARRIWRRRL